jgi:hypothetical protein
VVKTSAKPTAKASAKTVVKPLAKVSAKRVVKAKTAAAKPLAKSPIRKPARENGKTVHGSSSKPGRIVKHHGPAIHSATPAQAADKPVSDSAVSKLIPESAVQSLDSGIVVNRPVSETAKES